MIDTLFKAITLVSIIVLGYLLKKLSVLKKEDFKVISTIVMKITLPCALIVKLNGLQFEPVLLFVSLFSFFCCIVYMAVAYGTTRGMEDKQFSIINVTGYNIGNFTLPFVSYFFDSYSVLVACLFDVGNAVWSLGGAYGFANSIKEGNITSSVKVILTNIFQSVPIIIYLIMVPMGLLGIEFPSFVMGICEVVAEGNTFLSMLMIGIAIEFITDAKFAKLLVRLLILRYGIAFLISLAIFGLIPFDQNTKLIIIIMLFSPVTSMASVYTQKIKGNYEASACMNSMMIVISIIILSLLLIVNI